MLRFFLSDPNHRHLHSFPTRRSSDLFAHTGDHAEPRLEQEVAAAPGGEEEGEATASRSEEHTSELQSRVDLVCRLLLEKKKRLNLIPIKPISICFSVS